MVSVSDFGPHHIRVEWGPLRVAQVLQYMVEYGAIPSGRAHTLTLRGQQNFALLTELEPATQYLVTVSALYADGKERAMSVRACTEEGMLVKKHSGGSSPPSLFSISLFSFYLQQLYLPCWTCRSAQYPNRMCGR